MDSVATSEGTQGQAEGTAVWPTLHRTLSVLFYHLHLHSSARPPELEWFKGPIPEGSYLPEVATAQ